MSLWLLFTCNAVDGDHHAHFPATVERDSCVAAPSNVSVGIFVVLAVQRGTPKGLAVPGGSPPRRDLCPHRN